MFFKKCNKISGVINSHHRADFMDFIFGGKEQLPGGVNSFPVQVLYGGNAICIGKFPANPIFADAE